VKGAKFLFIAANEGTEWGGSEILWSSAAEKLVHAGNEVRISIKDWGKPLPQIEHLRSAGCKIFYRRTPAAVSRLVRKILPLTDSCLALVREAGNGVDLIIVSQGANFDGIAWMEAVRAAGVKYAIIAQGAAEYWWPRDDLAEKLAVSYEKACAGYFVSQANLELSRRQFATDLRNGKVVQNPYNVRYDAQPAWPGDPSVELSLACVARLDAGHKGHDILLEVLSLAHWRERRIRVSFVGKGIHERGLRRNAEQLGLKSVEFSGHLNDIEDVWSKHHAMVLATRYEGMPLALVEAMLCGRAPIVTDVASHAELVRDGVNGFLAKAPTVEFLDEAMSRAWNSRMQLREMGERAASDVRKWVSKDPAEDFARELERLVDGNGKQ
jgi:glycosyltransferase involved in cell wall biosynthesis